MTKDEVCKAAGVSPRTIDRAVKAGLLAKATYIEVKGHMIPDYAAADVHAYIETLKVNTSPVAALVAQQRADITRQESMADGFLDKFFDRLMSVPGFNRFQETTNGHKSPTVDLKDKHILSVREAAKLSGIPRSRLIAAYRSGILPGFYNDPRVGRGYRFERADLRGYTAKLSGEQHEK